MITYKALSALLQYPSDALVEAAGEIGAALRADGRLGRSQLAGIDRLVARLTVGDLLGTQEDYVALFDRSRSLSLHLFEHVHGESRDRGQAMVNLIAHYEANGYCLESNELPDFLPLFLEFLSLVEYAEAADLLADIVHILAALRVRLERRGSDYAAVFAALECLAARKPDAASVAALLEADRPAAREQEELDAEWEEEPAFAGSPDGACPAARETLNRVAELSAADRSPRADGA